MIDPQPPQNDGLYALLTAILAGSNPGGGRTLDPSVGYDTIIPQQPLLDGVAPAGGPRRPQEALYAPNAQAGWGMAQGEHPVAALLRSVFGSDQHRPPPLSWSHATPDLLDWVRRISASMPLSRAR